MSKRVYTADDAPLETWLGYTAPALAKRLEANGLSAESLREDGLTLGEYMCKLSEPFSLFDRQTKRHDNKLQCLLNTTTDPEGPAAIWLRVALCDLNSDHLSENMDRLTGALLKKIQTIPQPELLCWGVFALRAAHQCVGARAGRMMAEAYPAISRFLGTAWITLPENMCYEGQPLIPIYGDNTHPVGQAFHQEAVRIQEAIEYMQPMAPELLPLELWALTTTQEMSLVDKASAATNWGLVDHSFIGHAGFRQALLANTHWPDDPRIAPCLAYLQEKRHLVAPHVAVQLTVSRLEEEASQPRLGRASARL